jgi:hypothetical protein
MDPQSERITWKTLVGFLFLAAFIAMVAAPIVLWVGGQGRPIVIRLAVAGFCAVVLGRLARVLREDAGIGQGSAAERALEPHPVPAYLDPLLARLAQELRIGLRWHEVPKSIQERLRQMSIARTGQVPPELEPGLGQRVMWQDVERVVDAMERSA